MLFAGSLVVFDSVYKRVAAFKSENIKRPEPEKKAVQLPVKIQELQKKDYQPKVTTRMVAPTARTFTLPAMELPEIKFEAAGRRADLLSLSSHSMPGGLDLGVTGINFFGTRSSGEKIVFILDASRQMMEDDKGGYYTYKFAKDKIHQLVDAMPAATLFNVMVYNDNNVDMFRPQLVPATQANRDALKVWLEPVNSNPSSVGQVAANYRSAFTYQTAIGGGVRHWLKPVQAAMEQTADNIFVLCAGFGRYPIRQSSGGVERDESKMAEYRAKLAAVNEKALKAFNAENEARATKGLPPKIVYNWNDYMEHELRLVMPDPPPAIRTGGSSIRSSDQPERPVIEHLDAVWDQHYTPKQLMPPRVNFVYLIASDTSRQSGYDEVQALQKTADAFRGDFEFLRGAKTMKNLLLYNRDF